MKSVPNRTKKYRANIHVGTNPASLAVRRLGRRITGGLDVLHPLIRDFTRIVRRAAIVGIMANFVIHVIQHDTGALRLVYGFRDHVRDSVEVRIISV